tara:strand:+ start:17511 stop:17807 length:297 start_codon:yes stop_codon:yes gene_type:complete
VPETPGEVIQFSVRDAPDPKRDFRNLGASGLKRVARLAGIGNGPALHMVHPKKENGYARVKDDSADNALAKRRSKQHDGNGARIIICATKILENPQSY